MSRERPPVLVVPLIATPDDWRGLVDRTGVSWFDRVVTSPWLE